MSEGKMEAWVFVGLCVRESGVTNLSLYSHSLNFPVFLCSSKLYKVDLSAQHSVCLSVIDWVILSKNSFWCLELRLESLNFMFGWSHINLQRADF